MDFWHVLNRGVEKRTIVQDDRDRVRFVQCLYYMNDERSSENALREISHAPLGAEDERQRLVTVHAWCLMGNHYHLLLSENTDGGIGRYTRKLNIGYTHYFNLRHERGGVLFQGKTKRVAITSDRQFLYIMPYIHLNPLDFHKVTRDWRVQCVTQPTQTIERITSYRWSSYRNYAGESDFEAILAGSDLFAQRTAHVEELKHFLHTVPELDNSKITLE